jgi:GxxExxY protein
MTLTRVYSPLPAELEQLVEQTIGCCIAVHRELGPGLSEYVYSTACQAELKAKGIPFESEKALPVRYRGIAICHHRVDVFIDNRLVLEVKSVDRLHPVHVAQVVSYLRLTGARVGLIANFNVEVLRNGLRRVVM